MQHIVIHKMTFVTNSTEPLPIWAINMSGGMSTGYEQTLPYAGWTQVPNQWPQHGPYNNMPYDGPYQNPLPLHRAVYQTLQYLEYYSGIGRYTVPSADFPSDHGDYSYSRAQANVADAHDRYHVTPITREDYYQSPEPGTWEDSCQSPKYCHSEYYDSENSDSEYSDSEGYYQSPEAGRREGYQSLEAGSQRDTISTLKLAAGRTTICVCNNAFFAYMCSVYMHCLYACTHS